MTEAASLPVLLIPGLGCTARLYTEQMPALWTFGPVTVADHRRADSMDEIARQILAEAPRRFALAGLSMGGYIALAIMRIAPERVMRLALLDTGSRSLRLHRVLRGRLSVLSFVYSYCLSLIHISEPTRPY